MDMYKLESYEIENHIVFRYCIEFLKRSLFAEIPSALGVKQT
jgi:hypothetical protein